MKSSPKAYAIAVVVLEIIFCFLIYLACVCIRRLRCRQTGIRRIFFRSSLGDSSVAGVSVPKPAADSVLVFFPYSALKGFDLGETRSLVCAGCLIELKNEDKTLRVIPKCGHVFHPLCLVDPCSTLCPYCKTRTDFKSDINEVELKLEIEDEVKAEAKPSAFHNEVEVEVEVEAKPSAINNEVEAELNVDPSNAANYEVEVEANIEPSVTINEVDFEAQAKPIISDCMSEDKPKDVVVEIEVLEEKIMTKLPQEIMEKIIAHAKFVLPSGKICSRTRYLW